MYILDGKSLQIKGFLWQEALLEAKRVDFSVRLVRFDFSKALLPKKVRRGGKLV